jgi:hypothetical protein
MESKGTTTDNAETMHSETLGYVEGGLAIKEVPSPYSSSGRRSKKCIRIGVIALLVLTGVAVTLGVTLSGDKDDDSNDTAASLASWIPVGEAVTVEPDDLPADQYFASMDLSEDGDTLVVAGLSNDHTAEVRLFRWLDDDWEHVSTVPLGDEEETTRPVVSLAANGLKLAVGDSRTIETDIAETFQGIVRVFDLTQENFELLAQIQQTSLWGSAVALDDFGVRLAVGSPNMGAEDTPSVNAGQLTVMEGDSYDDVKGTFTGFEAHDGLGQVIAISGFGGTLAAGMPLKSSAGLISAGQIRVWYQSGGEWVERPSIMGQTGQGLGSQVQLSRDGQVLAASSMLTETIQIYELNGSTDAWVPVGAPLEGTSFSMTGEGKEIAVVHPDNKTVQVYSWDMPRGVWVKLGAALPGVDCVLSETRLVVHTADRLIHSWELVQA